MLKIEGVFLIFHITKELYYFGSKLIDLAKTRFKPSLGVKDPLMGILKLIVARAWKEATMCGKGGKKDATHLQLSMICEHVVAKWHCDGDA